MMAYTQWIDVDVVDAVYGVGTGGQWWTVVWLVETEFGHVVGNA